MNEKAENGRGNNLAILRDDADIVFFREFVSLQANDSRAIFLLRKSQANRNLKLIQNQIHVAYENC